MVTELGPPSQRARFASSVADRGLAGVEPDERVGRPLREQLTGRRPRPGPDRADDGDADIGREADVDDPRSVVGEARGRRTACAPGSPRRLHSPGGTLGRAARPGLPWPSATSSQVCSNSGAATRVMARTFDHVSVPSASAARIASRCSKAMATRTCSLAATRPRSHFHQSQCVADAHSYGSQRGCARTLPARRGTSP